MSSPESGSTGTAKLDFTTFHNVINGKLGCSSQTRHGINPATKQPNAEVPVTTLDDVDDAVAAARAAFKIWCKTSIDERVAALNAFAAALLGYKDEFARLMTIEQGKTLDLATMEIMASYAWLTETAKLELPEEVMEDNENRTVITRYTPLGVVGAIVPWNFPLHLAIAKVAPAVYTGNTIIVKPSPFTPYCGLKAMELAQQFFPPGVIQVLSGDDKLGPWLTAHQGIDKISFTGSVTTGKKVMESASMTLKRVTLELGGNDAAIVCKSVDIKKIAPSVGMLAVLNSGQICVAVKRLYIHESIYNDFRSALVEFVNSLKVGNGLEEGVVLGPIQNSVQYDRVQGFFDDVEKENMKIAVGGRAANSKGYFINPTIIDNPKDDSKIVTEEPFGPIFPILSWSDEEEVITRANNSKLGLGASVWSSDLDEASRIAKRLEAGSVWVNAHAAVEPQFAFSGHKESGIGSEWGVVGLKSFCNTQTLYLPKRL